jgi:mannose-6-phosphate isomerase class I
MGGGNLSLQVHPLVAYIQDRFGMAYTQDESYYILDATADSCVYLGVKTGTDKDEMFASLRRAAAGKEQFADERYVNKIPVAKHDHIHIPSGTVHAGGAGTVILEISATPYIFTFKLWDWGRAGLDGLPRPVHLDHGERNVLVERDTACAEGRLTDRIDAPHEDLSREPGVRVEKTGLAEEEFIETRRYWFRDAATLSTFESVNELNLVEGESVVVESMDGSFSPLPVHYGETFIVPERVGTYRIRNAGDPSKEVAVIQAFVRNL